MYSCPSLLLVVSCTGGCFVVVANCMLVGLEGVFIQKEEKSESDQVV
jgi:hypothetical protein